MTAATPRHPCCALTLAVAIAGPLAGCDRGEQSAERLKAASAPTTASAAAPSPEPPKGPAATLALRLRTGLKYDITGMSMMRLPMVERPVGVARHYSATVGECTVDHCDLGITLDRIEGEPPAGRIYEGDDAPYLNRTTHTLVGPTGAPLAPSTYAVDAVEGEGEGEPTIAAPDGRLAKAHPLFCIQLPRGEVRVGDTWSAECFERRGAMFLTRKDRWTLKALDADPHDGKPRAHLAFESDVIQHRKSGDRPGQMRGELFFFVGHGQPHILKDELNVALDDKRTVVSRAARQVTFGLPAGESLTQTNGAPFAVAPMSGAPPSPTTDAKQDAAAAPVSPPRAQGGPTPSAAAPR